MTWKANFVRKMLRADYRLDDALFGSVADTRGAVNTARRYLEADKARRSKYVGDRCVYLFNNCLVALIFGGLSLGLLLRTTGVTSSALSGNDVTTGLIVAAILFLLFSASCWFALKSHSWLRWMVRYWNAPMMPRKAGMTQRPGKKFTSNKVRSPAPTRWRIDVPPVGPSDMLDLAREWFTSEFIRKHIKADYRPGDRVFLLFVRGPVWQYPDEYLSDDAKVGRAVMIMTRLLPIALALGVLYGISPSNISSVLPPASHLAMAVIYYIGLWMILIGQSFLRWMVRNWDTKARDL